MVRRCSLKRSSKRFFSPSYVLQIRVVTLNPVDEFFSVAGQVTFNVTNPHWKNHLQQTLKVKEAFLVTKGRTIDPDGHNIHEENILVYFLSYIPFFIFIIVRFIHMFSLLYIKLALRISGITKLS